MGTGIYEGEGCIGTEMQRTAAPCLQAPAMPTPPVINHLSAASSPFITRASVLQAGASGPAFGVQQGKIRANPSPNSHCPCTQPDPSSAKPTTPMLGFQQLRLWKLLPSLPLLATKLQHGQLGAVLGNKFSSFLLSEKVPFPGMERRQASPLSAAVTQGWLCAPRTHSTLQQQQPAQHLG